MKVGCLGVEFGDKPWWLGRPPGRRARPRRTHEDQRCEGGVKQRPLGGAGAMGSLNVGQGCQHPDAGPSLKLGLTLGAQHYLTLSHPP